MVLALVRRSDEDLDRLADLLAPRLAARLLKQPRIWGDPTRVAIGRHVHVNNALFNTTSGTITVEDFVFFGHDVSVLTGTHDMTKRDGARIEAVPPSGRDVVIRRGAWIASGTTILAPCEIGAHAVIGAGSLVTGDVRPGWFYAGTPAKAVKEIEFHP